MKREELKRVGRTKHRIAVLRLKHIQDSAQSMQSTSNFQALILDSGRSQCSPDCVLHHGQDPLVFFSALTSTHSPSPVESF